LALNSCRKLAHPKLREAVAWLYKKCADLKHLRIFRIEDSLVQTIDEYADSLLQQRVAAAATRERIMLDIRDYLTRLGEQFIIEGIEKLPEFVPMADFKPGSQVMGSSASQLSATPRRLDGLSLHQSSVATSRWNYGDAGLGTAGAGLDGDQTLTNDSVYARFLPTKLSYIQRSLIRQNCRHFQKFLRWVDFVIRDACYANIDFVMSRFSLFVAGMDFSVNDAGDTNIEPLVEVKFDSSSLASRPKMGVFLVTAVLHTPDANESLPPLAGLETGMNDEIKLCLPSTLRSTSSTLSITPTRADIDIWIAALLSDTKAFGIYTTSFCSMEMCGDLLSPMSDELPILSLENLIDFETTNSVNTYQRLSYNIVKEDIYQCEQIVGSYRSFITQTADFLSGYLAKSTVDMFYSISVDGMTAQLNEFWSLNEKIQAIPGEINVGTLLLRLDAVQQRLFKLVQECIGMSHKLIPEYFAIISDRFNISVSILLRSLQEPPESLDQFVAKVEIYQKAMESLENQRVEFALLTGIREMLDSFTISYKNILPMVNSTVTVWGKNNDAVSEFTEKLENRTKQYKTDLKARARVLLAPMETAKGFIVSNFVLNPASDPTAVLKELVKFQSEMEAVRSESRIIERYQDIIKVKVFNIEPVIEIIEDLNRYKIQWNTMKLIKEMQLELLESKFMDVSCEQMLRDIRTANVTISNQITQSGTNLVLAWLREAVDDLQMAVPVIVYLQAPTLKDRHTVVIHSSIGRPIFDELDLTVSELIALGLKDSRIVIQRVYERSLYEQNIEKKMASIARHCDSKVVDLTSDRDNKNIVYFANLEECLEFYGDMVITIDAMSRSEFSSPFTPELVALQASTSKGSEVCRSLHLLQGHYLRYRVLFSSTRTARHLNFCMRVFKVIDESWRQLMKAARADPNVSLLVQNDSVLDSIMTGTAAATELEHAILRYLDEQTDKWPKLNLLTQERLLNAFATSDPHDTFLKCREVMPHLSDLVFDTTDVNSVVAAVSGTDACNETVELMRAASARSSLIDWLQNIDLSLADRLHADFRASLELHENRAATLVDEIKNSKVSLQSKICSIQVKFWGDFESALKKTNHDDSGQQKITLRFILKDIFDKIRLIQASKHILNKKIETLSFDTALTTLLDYRDFAASLIIDEENQIDISHSFRTETKFKKIWDPRTSSVLVKYGLFTSVYGFRYLGLCGNRLVITPATEKFFVAVAIASNQQSHGYGIPVISGKTGRYKAELLKYMGDELGVETIVQDCSFIVSIQDIYRYIKAAFGCGLWMIFDNVEMLPKLLLSECLTALSLVRQTLLESNTQKRPATGKVPPPQLHLPDSSITTMVVASQHNSSNQSPVWPRFSLVQGSGTDCPDKLLNCEFLGRLPDSLRSMFRPLHIVKPNLEFIIKYSLAVANFANLTLITTRLYACAQYLISHYNIDECVIRRVVKRGIRSAGSALLVALEQAAASTLIISNPSTSAAAAIPVTVITSLKFQTELLYKHTIVPLLEHALIEKIPDTDLRFVCSMFLEICNTGSANSEVGSAHNAMDQLVSILMLKAGLSSSPTCSYPDSNLCGGESIIVVGSVGIGKSTVIREALKNVSVAAESAKQPVFAVQSNSFNKAKSRNIIPVSVMPRVLNPWIMADDESNADGRNIGCRVDNILETAIQAAYDSEYETVHKYSDVLTRFVHVDAPSSAHLSTMLPLMKFANVQRDKSKVCIVWEVCDISHLDPAQAFDIPIVHVPTPPTEDIGSHVDRFIAAQVDKVSSREGLVLRDLLTQCVSVVLNPCVDYYIAQSALNLEMSVSWLISSVFRMFETVLTAAGLTTKIKGKWDELSVKRIFVYCCIWIIGSSSVNARDSFDPWFKEYFEKASKTMKGWSTIYAVFPLMLQQCTIFDSILQPVEEDSVKLEWIIWDPSLRNRIITELTNSPAGLSPALSKAFGYASSPLPESIETTVSSLLFMPHINVYATGPLRSPTVLMHTPLSASLRFYQNCVLHVRNSKLSTEVGTNEGCSPVHSVMIVGDACSGKTSLLQHLISDAAIATKSRQNRLADTSNKHLGIEDIPIFSRWVCVVTASNSATSLYKSVRDCKHCARPGMICRDAPNLGALFIEDVNIEQSAVSDATECNENYACIEATDIIRHVAEHGEYFDPSLKKWESCLGQYHVLTASASSLSRDSADSATKIALNERLLRHFIMFSVPQSDTIAVNARILKKNYPLLPEEICDDILTISHKLIGHFKVVGEIAVKNEYLDEQQKHMLRTLASYPSDSSIAVSVDENADIEDTATNPDAVGSSQKIDDHPTVSSKNMLFHKLICLQPTNVTVSQLLTPIATTLGKMSVYTTVDVVRIWERTVCDYLAHDDKEMQHELDSALEDVVKNTIFKFGTFGDLVRRERSKHTGAIAQAHAQIQKGTEKQSITMPIGYANNKDDGFVGMFHPAHLREQFQGKNAALTSNTDHAVIDKDSQDFWYSCLKLYVSMTSSAAGNRQGVSSVTLTHAHAHGHRVCDEVVQAAAFVASATYTKVSIGSSITDIAIDIIESHVLSNFFKFLDCVLNAYKLPTAREEFDDLSGWIDEYLMRDMEVFEAKLSSVITKPLNHAGISGAKCCYHICFSGECTSSALRRFWSLLDNVMTLYSAYARQMMVAGRFPDPATSPVMRRLIQAFVGCQYLVFSFHDDASVCELLSPKKWCQAPPLLGHARIVDLHAPVCHEAYGLKKLLGPELTHWPWMR
jgi:tRNA A37 threonylcarbamoyladenosine biosynthesis protein TsaE